MSIADVDVFCPSDLIDGGQAQNTDVLNVHVILDESREHLSNDRVFISSGKCAIDGLAALIRDFRRWMWVALAKPLMMLLLMVLKLSLMMNQMLHSLSVACLER